ncbi:MAG TPA: 3-oxoacyl-[acyl-carrier-protein] synthase III C-terminal domain-containing protein [Candidatus Binatia bacterium]|nr:3-oxoacyl-[acyl-carrier-protein] synthase III C-terminal domain-containing protein [Candidatus Binatia bacterium]
MNQPAQGERDWQSLVVHCLRTMLPADAAAPSDDIDWIENGLLDSMAHVEVLACVEKAALLPGVFDHCPDGPPRTIRAAVDCLRRANSAARPQESRAMNLGDSTGTLAAGIAGWSHCVGEESVSAQEVEREFGLPTETISRRAGIESVARVPAGVTELDLAERAAARALLRCGFTSSQVDYLIVSSETFVGLPSLGFRLHRRLALRADCGILDVGGACAGLVNALFVAAATLRSSAAASILVATADVHQHALPPGKVDGKFAGLFGDGASAFLLTAAPLAPQQPHYRLGEFTLGCNGDSSNLLSVRLDEQSVLQLEFDGDALGRAAVRQLDALLRRLEAQSGCALASAARFATHQPNPRLLEMLSRQSGLPLEKFPVVCKRYGNLGSSTSGVALSMALEECSAGAASPRGPIFLAALGPGLVWGGCVVAGAAMAAQP